MSSGKTNTLYSASLIPDVHFRDIREIENFWSVWTQNYDFLFTLCLRWVKGNEAEAHEVMSSVMMRALDHLTASDRMIQNPKAWLAQVLRNYCIDQFRKQARNPNLSIDLEYLASVWEQQLDRVSFSPEHNMVEDEGYNRLKAVIESLPDRLRSVLILHAYNEMTYKDIARHLEISTANTRKRIQEARGIVRRSLDANATSDIRHRNSADPNPNSPRSERKAAEDELIRLPGASFQMEPIGHLALVQVDQHRAIELPIATKKRPIRLRQKLDHVEQYILKHPNGWRKRIERAHLLALQGRLREASLELTRVLERKPQQVETLLIATRWMQWTDSIHEASHILQKGLSIIPDNAWRSIFEGKLYSLFSQFSEANTLFEQACLKTPKPVFQLFLAENLMAMGCWEKALFHLESNAMRQGRLQSLVCLAKLGKVKERKLALQRAAKTYPNDPLLLTLTLEERIKDGMVYGEPGRFTRHLFNRLQRTAPGSSVYLFGMVAYHTYRDKPGKALEILFNAYQTTSFPLQHLILGEKWFTNLGNTDFAARLEVLRNELFPDLRPWREILYYLPWNI